MFYRNLIRIAEALDDSVIPVDFEVSSGDTLYLDRGCIKIAEHARFIMTLEDDREGVVSSVKLGWST
jgi:hypothetical protein